MKLNKLFISMIIAGIFLCSQKGFAQQPAAEKLVRSYYAAYDKKDSSLLISILSDKFTFSSPVDEHISLKNYLERCWPNCYKLKKFDIVKLIIKGDDAFVTYNGWTTDGKLFRNTEYFVLKDGKIMSNECFFGPGVNYPNNSGK